jgi:hypothetical protein
VRGASLVGARAATADRNTRVNGQVCVARLTGVQGSTQHENIAHTCTSVVVSPGRGWPLRVERALIELVLDPRCADGRL